MDVQTLMAHHYDGLRRKVAAVLHDREAAEDIAQESFFVLWSAHNRGVQIDDPAAFLHGTIKKLVLAHIRGKCRKKAAWKRLLASTQVPPDEPPGGQGESGEILLSLVDQLWPEARELVSKHFLRDQSIEEAGKELGLSRTTAYERYREAMEGLRELAKSHGLLE